MPNWVFNGLTAQGPHDSINKMKSQLNSPFTRTHENWNFETKEYVTEDVVFSNPIFSFWNIIKPTDIEAYNSKSDLEGINNPDNWYPWNNRNWGTKWDVAIPDNDNDRETYMEETEDELTASVYYNFNTAWDIPNEGLINLSSQYPEILFTLSYEEESGWGGEHEYLRGKRLAGSEYNWKCNECDYMECNDPDVNFCEDCEDVVCPTCGFGTSEEGCEKHTVEANV